MAETGNNLKFCCKRITALGPVAIRWELFRDTPKISRIFLSNQEVSAPAESIDGFPKNSCAEIDLLLEQIERFISGENIRFSIDNLNLKNCSDFQQKVLLADYSIPRGRVSSYGHLSSHLGVPGGARAVGTALATNPFPLVIPCHRVIRSDGTLGGFQGGLGMKKALLEKEGLLFQGKHKVINPGFYLF